MFRELDQRHGDGLTITLEWESTTGEVRLRCEDRRSPQESFSYPVCPDHARLAFLHPFALRPSRQEPRRQVSSPTQADGVGASRWRRWLRQRRAAEAAGAAADYTWMLWPGA